MKLMTLLLLLGTLPFAATAAPANAPAPPAGAKTAGHLKTTCPNPAPLCNGVTDDTCELQELLKHTNPAMTVVEIPATPEGCVISDPLYVSSNTHVIQNGLIKFDLSGHTWSSPSAQVGMYTLEDGTHDVIIEGTGVLDGSHPGFLYTPSGCCMGGIVTGPDLAAYTIGVTDVTIRGLTIRNIPHWPLELDGVKGLLVDGLTMHDSGNSPGIGHGSEDVVVNNLRIYRIDDVCFSFYRGVENAVISNSIVNECSGGGISVISDHPNCVGPPQFSKNVIVNNSIAYGQNTLGFGSGGFDVNGIGTEGEVSESVSMTFNLAHSHAAQGFGVTPGRHVLVAGNVSHGQGYTRDANYPAGIQLEGAQGVLVSSNSIFDEGEFTGTGWGVFAKHRTATAAIPPQACSEPVPALPEMTLARTSILDNYVFNSTSPPNILSALRSDVPLVLVVAGNTYAPTGGVADDFIYDTGSHNADNDDQP